MADTETTTTTPTATTTTEVKGTVLETTSSTKPGWRTSEFWKGLVVLLLVTLLSSGIIPTTGAGAQITAIVGAVLTFLGYAGARTWLKGSTP